MQLSYTARLVIWHVPFGFWDSYLPLVTPITQRKYSTHNAALSLCQSVPGEPGMELIMCTLAD